MLLFIFQNGLRGLDGHCETDVEPTPLAFESQDPDEAYGTRLEWGYGLVHERNDEGLVRVEWAFPDGAPEYVEPLSLTDSRNLCRYGTRKDYLELGGKMWAEDRFWRYLYSTDDWRWKDEDS